jgi:hypothetical protein
MWKKKKGVDQENKNKNKKKKKKKKAFTNFRRVTNKLPRVFISEPFLSSCLERCWLALICI